MKKVTIAVLVFLAFSTFVAVAEEAADGKAAFTAKKCNMCHAVSTVGIEATVKSEAMKGPDLVGTVAAHGAENVTKYLKKESQLNGKDHKSTFKGTDAELGTIVTWLGAQTK